MRPPKELKPKQLYTSCTAADIKIPRTGDYSSNSSDLGQTRALEALNFGIAMKRDGYNVFAHGAPGTGKHTIVNRHLKSVAGEMPTPSDWCYVNNFDDPRRPKAISLPAGRGNMLRVDMDNLIQELRVAIPAAFEGEDYQARVQAIQSELAEQHETAFNVLQEHAAAKNVALIRTSGGFALAPVSNGEVVNPDAFRQWPEETQKTMRENISQLEKELQDILLQAPQWEKEQREKIRTLNRKITSHAIGHFITELKKNYADLPAVLDYVEQVRQNLMKNSEEFQTSNASSPEEMLAAAMSERPRENSFRRFRINVITDNSDTSGAPIIYEDLPTHANIIGRTEQMAQFGALTTDFNLIKAGALHNANGGFLLIDARKLLMQPIIWEELKRALFSREIRIQDLSEALGFSATISLQPEPIPLDAKIVLIGDSMIYYLLSQADPDFNELFKVAADFDDQVVRNSGNTALYGQLLSEIAKNENIRPLNKTAITRVIEHAARLASDSERLTLRMRPITDLLYESDYWASKNNHSKIAVDDVQRAIEARNHRSDRMRERSQEQILRDTLLIDTEGEAVGQINGLSVLQLGDFAFGEPTRITAQVRMGRGEVIDIEREVDLGGSIHSKGILILSGYIGAKFAKETPLALSASLVFEQSYGGVDGDSASSAELYALLSALSEVPINQSLAVTGSVNQFGQVQAIGGANEKIEGFYDICSARGLTGKQGVLIPAANTKHLMLRQDVIDSVSAGMFHVYPVDHVDQGIELLTGVPAGNSNKKGKFPPDSINGKVQETLSSFAERARTFSGAQNQKADGK